VEKSQVSDFHGTLTVGELQDLLDLHPRAALVKLWSLGSFQDCVRAVVRADSCVLICGTAIPEEGQVTLSGRPDLIASVATADQGGSLDG
jgi:hypothetical protein